MQTASSEPGQIAAAWVFSNKWSAGHREDERAWRACCFPESPGFSREVLFGASVVSCVSGGERMQTSRGERERERELGGNVSVEVFRFMSLFMRDNRSELGNSSVHRLALS